MRILNNLKLKNIFILQIFLVSAVTFSQNKADSLLIDIYKKSYDQRIVVRPAESKLVVPYKFCEDWVKSVDYLKLHLTEQQNEELINHENGTFNLIGLISNLTKHNSKNYALSQLEILKDKETKLITVGCGDAFTSLTLKEYYLKLLTEENQFVNTNFILSSEEIQQLIDKLK